MGLMRFEGPHIVLQIDEQGLVITKRGNLARGTKPVVMSLDVKESIEFTQLWTMHEGAVNAGARLQMQTGIDFRMPMQNHIPGVEQVDFETEDYGDESSQ